MRQVLDIWSHFALQVYLNIGQLGNTVFSFSFFHAFDGGRRDSGRRSAFASSTRICWWLPEPSRKGWPRPGRSGNYGRRAEKGVCLACKLQRKRHPLEARGRGRHTSSSGRDLSRTFQKLGHNGSTRPRRPRTGSGGRKSRFGFGLAQCSPVEGDRRDRTVVDSNSLNHPSSLITQGWTISSKDQVTPRCLSSWARTTTGSWASPGTPRTTS